MGNQGVESRWRTLRRCGDRHRSKSLRHVDNAGSDAGQCVVHLVHGRVTCKAHIQAVHDEVARDDRAVHIAFAQIGSCVDGQRTRRAG